MKTIILFVGALLFFGSCIDTSNTESSQNLADDEMKESVKPEEILFENETDRSIAANNTESSSEAPLNREPKHTASEDVILGRVYKRPVEPNWRLPDVPFCGPKAKTIEDSICLAPMVDAIYPGGILEMKKFIASNLRYPDPLADVDGVVYVSFVVEMDGCVTNVKLMRGIGEAFDREAIRVVKAMPNWIPAEDNGKIVAARLRLPIRFALN